MSSISRQSVVVSVVILVLAVFLAACARDEPATLARIDAKTEVRSPFAHDGREQNVEVCAADIRVHCASIARIPLRLPESMDPPSVHLSKACPIAPRDADGPLLLLALTPLTK